VSRSALRFDVGETSVRYGDLRLVYEDGEAMPELFAGEYPRRDPASFVCLGISKNGQRIAEFDLSGAALTASRDRDLVDLRFRFLDLTLTLLKSEAPVIRPRHRDCRVIETEPGRFRTTVQCWWPNLIRSMCSRKRHSGR
jgi:hypothetical protein